MVRSRVVVALLRWSAPVWVTSVATSVAAAPRAAPVRIAVLGATDAAVTLQLDAELELLGFEVVHADAPAHADPAGLSALARQLDVVAAILVDARGGDIDLWIVDRTTGKTLIRSVRVDDEDRADAARIAAVRSIDLLRASFRELQDDPAPPAAEVRAPPVVRAAMRPRAPRFQLAFGPAVTGSAGGLGAMAHAALAFEAWPHRRFGIGVRTGVPIAGVQASATEGSARILLGWVGLGPRVRLTRADHTVGVALGLQAGPAFAGMRGQASAPYVGQRDLVVAALVELDLALAIAVHPRLRIWIDGSIGVATPRVGIRIADRRVAAWGVPVGAGVVGFAIPL